MCWLALISAIVLSACGGDDDSTELCSPGESGACTLPDGRSGERLCGADFRWEACGEVGDGGVPIGVDTPDVVWLDEGAPPIAPPMLACPPGWRTVPAGVAGDRASCDPFPEGGPLDCPEGQAHFAGETGCVPVGAPCPAGEVGEDLPVGRTVIYVRPGASGGDGSAGRPYGRLSEFAVGGLPTGTVIALSTGTHEGPARVSRGVVVQGACAQATLLRTPAPAPPEGAVMLLGTGGAVRDLTVADTPRRGVQLVGASVEGRLEGVVVTGMEAAAIEVFDGSRLSAQTVVVRDTAARIDGSLGLGMSVERGSATADIRRAIFEHNLDSAMFAGGAGTTLTLADVVVRDTESQRSDGLFGRGVAVQGGATADVSRALLDHNHDIGAYASGTGTTLTLADVVVRDTEGRELDGNGGHGISVGQEATATVRRALLERNRDVAVYTSDPATALTLDDAIARDTRGLASDGTSGGIEAWAGAMVDASRTIWERNGDHGVFACGPATMVMLADVVVRDNEALVTEGLGGHGLHLLGGATVEVRRALFERNSEIGVYALEPTTTLTLVDVAVRDTRSHAVDGLGGAGLAVEVEAAADVIRALFERNRANGVGVSLGAAATLTDVVVRDTLRSDDDRFFGRGLNVQDGATTEVRRGLLERNREVGVAVFGPSTRLTLSHVVVRDTLPWECSAETCLDLEVGHGVGVYGGTTRMADFAVQRANTCGLHIARDGSLDLASGEVRGNPIGACVQVEDYDVARLTTDVRFIDNEANLQVTTLPVPTAVVPVRTP